MGTEEESMKEPSSTPQGPRGSSACWMKWLNLKNRLFRSAAPFLQLDG